MPCIGEGKYFRNCELNCDEKEGYNSLYETKGGLISSNEIILLADSTFGGGSLVNWSICLRTFQGVKRVVR